MDEIFASDLAMLEEDDEDVFPNNSKLSNDSNRVSTLRDSQHYIDIMHKIDHVQECDILDDTQFQLVVDANALLVNIEDEIAHEYNLICDKYRSKFPELESLVHHPVDYARVVKMIANETDLTHVPWLKEVLPAAVVMVLSITASTTSGKPLAVDVLERTVKGCDHVIELDSAKIKILNFVEGRVSEIAPNLSAVVGGAVAARLIAAVGSLAKLANMPACDVQLLGGPKKDSVGFSRQTRVGYIEQAEVFQSTPVCLRDKVSSMLSAKSVLAARVDFVGGDSTGQFGRELVQEVRKKIEKLQELPTPKIRRSLHVPNDSGKNKKRGGRRLRKMKERYSVTQMRQLANRVRFNVPEESSLGDGLGIGYGMLGQDGGGKLRVSATPTKLKLSKKYKEKVVSYGGRNRMEVGFSSGFAFTPVQGIELPNRQADVNQLSSGLQSTYFSETATFSKIKS